MEIGKLNAAIEHAGFNPFGITGTSEQDAQKLAEKNSISLEEAKSVIDKAQGEVEEIDKLFSQQSNLIVDLVNSQDEEEIYIIDDGDFDNFLKEQSPEQKMEELLHQQKFVAQNNSVQEPQRTYNEPNFFAQQDNPFWKMKL